MASVCYGQADGPYQITKVSIDNDNFIRSIGVYIEEFKDDLNVGTLILKFDDVNDRFYISFLVYKEEVVARPPSFYSVIDGNIVLIYTGFESYLQYDEKSFNQLFSDTHSHLHDLPITILYDPIVWRVNAKGQNFEKEVIDEIPW